MVGFKLEHHNLPSNGLIDKANTILVKGVVKYMAWLYCTSRTQENRHEPELKGLRLTAEGLLTQDVDKEQQTNINGEMLWDYALRRRSLACDIAGLMMFESGNAWHEDLKEALLKVPPAGCSPIGWNQIRDADQALWDYIAEKCEAGTKVLPGESTTNFEKFWLEGMRSTEVLQHLHFHKSSLASSSSRGAPVLSGEAETKLAKLRSHCRAHSRKCKASRGSWAKAKARGTGKAAPRKAKARREPKVTKDRRDQREARATRQQMGSRGPWPIARR